MELEPGSGLPERARVILLLHHVQRKGLFMAEIHEFLNGFVWFIGICWVISLCVTIYFGYQQFQHQKIMRWYDENISWNIYVSAGITAVILFIWALLP